MLSEKFVGIIIVTWNKEKYVLQLLAQLNNIDHPNYEINVVDNASDDLTVEKIKAQFPDVNLIENKENLGGTGGFNTGMRFAISQKKYDYVWLLDNDAMVEPQSLRGLLYTFGTDRTIGIAGSVICNPANKDMVIEQGGKVSWGKGIWETFHNNVKLDSLEERIASVDYVAACSMLVRRDVLEKIGVFDERMFVHWDDIEFCLRAKAAGFKIVSTSHSIIYHDSLKGIPMVFIYYDLRNALLAMSCHLNGAKRIFAIFMQLRRMLKGRVFSDLFHDKPTSHLVQSALDDFLGNNFYKSNHEFNYADLNNSLDKKASLVNFSNFLILPYGTLGEMIETARSIKSLIPSSRITLMLQGQNVSLLPENSCIDRVITFGDFRSNIFVSFMHFIRLFVSGFDVGIFSNEKAIIPFYAMALKTNLIRTETDCSFYYSVYNRSSIWKPFYAFIKGELLALSYLLKTVVRARFLSKSHFDYD